jgi:hypothetical protein
MTLVWLVLGVWGLVVSHFFAFVAGCASMEQDRLPACPDFVPPEWLEEESAGK